jgi:peptidylprolyl isomerase
LESNEIMKRTALILSVAAMAAVASAKTTAKPSTASSTPATTATKTGATASKTTAATSADWWLHLPPTIPRARGIVKTDFALRFEDVKIGTGAEAAPNMMYHVNYTGYLAATGVKFDSNADRKAPVMGKDGKPQLGPDGKPVMGEAQPLVFPQGMGRIIPGFDQGFSGMKIGGKRRIFIPWQLAYGTRDLPGHPPDHPGIPPKSNLIFDVELVDVTEMPKPPQRPQMPPQRPGAVPGGRPGAPGAPGAAPTPGAAPAPGAVPAPGTAPPAGTTARPAPTATPGSAPETPAPAPASKPAPTTPAPTPAPATPPPSSTPPSK